MKKIKEAVPFVLALSYITLLFFRVPTYADAIVSIAILALAGFKYYIDSKKTPDFKKLMDAELKKRDEELSALQGQIGKVSLGQSKQGAANEHLRW